MTQPNRQRPNDARQVRASLWLAPSSEEAGEWATNFRTSSKATGSAIADEPHRDAGDGAGDDHNYDRHQTGDDTDADYRLRWCILQLRKGAVLPQADSNLVADFIDARLCGEASARTSITIQNIARRNRLLRAAAVQFFPGQYFSQQAVELEQALTRYQRGAWQREQSFSHCPERYRGTLEASLFEIMRCGARPPRWRRLRNILATS
jgi:hypothetical protein